MGTMTEPRIATEQHGGMAAFTEDEKQALAAMNKWTPPDQPRKFREKYNEDSMHKPVSIVLSKAALAALAEKAEAMGLRRNELIRQVLYGVAFKETLAA